MKAKIVRVFHIVILILMIALVVYQLGWNSEDAHSKTIVRVALLVIVWELSILGIRRKRSLLDYKVYEDRYKDVIRDAFIRDKSSYRKLMKAIDCFNTGKYEVSVKILEKLRSFCVSTEDTSAVLMFTALNYSNLKQYHKSMTAYEELLKFDYMNSKAWSNLGMIYVELDMADKAEEAYLKAISYDRANPYAYNNLAGFYVTRGEAEKALDCALKSIEISPQVYQAMSAAAFAYAQLGDKENAMKYCKMYGTNGGDGVGLKKQILEILSIEGVE